MKKTLEIFDILDFTGPGSQVDLTYTLPNSTELDPDYYGTDYSDRKAAFLGVGTWYMAGQDWKMISVQAHSATQIRFVDNTGHIQLSQLHNGDVIKFSIKVHVE